MNSSSGAQEARRASAPTPFGAECTAANPGVERTISNRFVGGGVTWVRPVRAATTPSNETVRRATSFEYGDYEGLAAAGGVAHPLWTDSRDLTTRAEEIYTTVLTRADLQLP